MDIKPRILAVDDEVSMLKTYRSILKSKFNLVLVNNGQEAIKFIEEDNFTLVLLDLKLPGMNGIEILKKIKKINKDLQVLIVSAVQDIKTAVEAIKLGAYDYVAKPFEIDDLLSKIDKVLEKQALVRENIYLRETLDEKEEPLEFVGESSPAKKILELISKVAKSESTVLITGESGTGKELVARLIHKKSNRAEAPFIVVNCAAIPENLIESALFGHERGAFTGALDRKIGKFELADSGTIFLDEVGCLNSPMQAKFLRVLENNTIERVGSNKSIRINVRVLSATNLDLKKAISNNSFREDLFYRLNVIPIYVPPLKERKEDIPLLLKYFLNKYNRELNKNIRGFDNEAVEMLNGYNWPGNIREVQNLVERIAVLAEGNEYITKEEIPLLNEKKIAGGKNLKNALDDFEREYIKKVLFETEGNQSKASEILGINRTTLIAKMRKLGLK